MLSRWILNLFCLITIVTSASAQQTTKAPATETTKKANARTAETAKSAASAERFDKATVETMAAQCVKLETEAGVVEMEMLAESAPETVRNFLNLVALGAFDSTTFNRVVPGFVVQGGNIWTREKISPELDSRARRTIVDEPNQIRHVRGIVSMARPETPNGATTNFFILVGEAPHLDGSFAAFARVTRGMETVDSINKAPVENEKPTKPVRLTRASLQSCAAQAQ